MGLLLVTLLVLADFRFLGGGWVLVFVCLVFDLAVYFVQVVWVVMLTG